MKFITLCAFVLIATIGFTGCSSSTSAVLNKSGMPAIPPKVQTLEQVEKDMPFTVVIPNQLPHDIRFYYPLEEVNPNTNKPDSVLLMFSSPDQKYMFNVDERAIKEGMGQIQGATKAVEVNSYPGIMKRDDKGAWLLWNNGKVVFMLTAAPNTDIGSEQGLIDIAKSFK